MTLEGVDMQRGLGGASTLAVVATLMLANAGCTRPGPDPADKTEPPPPKEAPVLALGAANAGEVTRFADEEPFGPTAVVAQDKTRVRKSPGSGDVVATLPSGAEVVKLAAHGSDDHVCFDEPAPGSRHLMGWVAQSALQDPPPPAADDGGEPPPPEPDPPPPRAHHHRHRPHRRH